MLFFVTLTILSHLYLGMPSPICATLILHICIQIVLNGAEPTWWLIAYYCLHVLPFHSVEMKSLCHSDFTWISLYSMKKKLPFLTVSIILCNEFKIMREWIYVISTLKFCHKISVNLPILSFYVKSKLIRRKKFKLPKWQYFCFSTFCFLYLLEHSKT